MFEVKIRTTNAAYGYDDDGNGEWELIANLTGIIESLKKGCKSGQVRDTNGNHVGEWEWKGDE